MAYYVAIFFSKIFCLLPQGASMAIGKFLGELFWLVVPKRRKEMAKKNIVRCLETDEKTAEKIAKKSVTRFGTMIAEVLRFPIMKDRLSDFLVFSGKENIPSGVTTGLGSVSVTTHSGNWELLGAALSSLNIPTVAVGKKQTSAGADRFITEYRKLMGMHVTYKSDVREMFDLLKKGFTIGLLADQDPTIHDGIILTFLNRVTNCVTGPAALARFNNAPIIPLFLHRLDDGRHEVIIYPPLYVRKTKDKREDIKRTTQELNEIFEKHIRQYPEEWFWLHDRWKSVREEYNIE